MCETDVQVLVQFLVYRHLITLPLTPGENFAPCHTQSLSSDISVEATGNRSVWEIFLFACLCVMDVLSRLTCPPSALVITLQSET